MTNKLRFVFKGGEGSGHFGHTGRPGKVGGSAAGSGGGKRLDISDANLKVVINSFIARGSSITAEEHETLRKLSNEWVSRGYKIEDVGKSSGGGKSAGNKSGGKPTASGSVTLDGIREKIALHGEKYYTTSKLNKDIMAITGWSKSDTEDWLEDNFSTDDGYEYDAMAVIDALEEEL